MSPAEESVWCGSRQIVRTAMAPIVGLLPERRVASIALSSSSARFPGLGRESLHESLESRAAIAAPSYSRVAPWNAGHRGFLGFNLNPRSIRLPRGGPHHSSTQPVLIVRSAIALTPVRGPARFHTPGPCRIWLTQMTGSSRPVPRGLSCRNGPSPARCCRAPALSSDTAHRSHAPNWAGKPSATSDARSLSS